MWAPSQGALLAAPAALASKSPEIWASLPSTGATCSLGWSHHCQPSYLRPMLNRIAPHQRHSANRKQHACQAASKLKENWCFMQVSMSGNRDCVTNVQFLCCSCALRMQEGSSPVVLTAISSSCAPLNCPISFGGEGHGEQQADLPLPRPLYTDLDKHVVFCLLVCF